MGFFTRIIYPDYIVEKFNALCGINFNDQDWCKIYCGSRDGFSAKDFHSKCDDKPNTLIIIRTVNELNFGGYAEKSWSCGDLTESIDIKKPDQNAFIFNFVDDDFKQSCIL